MKTPVETRLMSDDDSAFGQTLVVQAGWNQIETDWQRFLLLQRDGCFVATLDGQPAGTATTCVFDRVGWIAMVLVEQRFRSRGIGRALLNQAITFLENQGVGSIRLDATSLGEPLYRSLGFEPQFRLVRYAGEVADDKNPVNESTQQASLPEISALDHRAVGYDRSSLLKELQAQETARLLASRAGDDGYAFIRPGRLAAQIGPCVAKSEATGRDLFQEAMARCPQKEVFIDVPIDNHAAINCVTSLNLQPAREFIRMCRGVPMREQIEQLWSSSGPEMG